MGGEISLTPYNLDSDHFRWWIWGTTPFLTLSPGCENDIPDPGDTKGSTAMFWTTGDYG